MCLDSSGQGVGGAVMGGVMTGRGGACFPGSTADITPWPLPETPSQGVSQNDPLQDAPPMLLPLWVPRLPRGRCLLLLLTLGSLS